jgi:site-specific DNA recombinase
MDVLLKDVAEKIEVRLLSPKAIEEAMRAWKEERKSDQRKNSERSNLERRHHVLNTEIERLSYAIANSRRKPDALVKRIDECDAERETVEERLRLLGNGGENVIPFDHPRFGDRYSRRQKDWSPRSRQVRRRSRLVSLSVTWSTAL